MSKVLKNLLRQPEGEQLDFKLTISNPQKIAKNLVAFANHLGGTLVVGVRDDHTVIGIDPEEEKYSLDQAATTYCHPPITLQYQTIYLPPATAEDEELVVLIASIPSSPRRPHYVQEKNGQSTCYIRQADQCLPASQAIEQQLRQGTYHPKPNVAASQVKDPTARRVLAYLQQEPKITVKTAARKFNMSERRAQRLLHQLTLQGLLREHDHEKENYYSR